MTTPHAAHSLPPSVSPPVAKRLAPFRSKDFRRLYVLNICEFFATTLSRLSALQWLFEATGDGRALGGLGLVTLVCQIPSIALGGVLADTLDRAKLVSRVQTMSAMVAFVRFLLCAGNALSPWVIYTTVGLLEVCARLESSARSAIITAVVSEADLPDAVTIVTITQYFGEILAPFAFWLLADVGGSSNAHPVDGETHATLTLAFAAAFFSYLPCAVLPRTIEAQTTPESAAHGQSLRSEDAKPPQDAGSGGGKASISRLWLQGLAKMVEGLRYIKGHPLLPGLYALGTLLVLVAPSRSGPLPIPDTAALAHASAGEHTILTRIALLGGVQTGASLASPSIVSSSPCGWVRGLLRVSRTVSLPAVPWRCSSLPTLVAAPSVRSPRLR